MGTGERTNAAKMPLRPPSTKMGLNPFSNTRRAVAYNVMVQISVSTPFYAGDSPLSASCAEISALSPRGKFASPKF